MKNPIATTILFVCAAFAVFSGTALAGGGGPQDPAFDCYEPPPEPTAGSVINGSFTVSRIPPSIGVAARYVVHIVLKKVGEVHLYQLRLDTQNVALCNFTEEMIITNLKLTPCELGIGQDFGIDGYPVIFSLSIENQDLCGTNDAMIEGSLKIRVVPI
jgi:hypothetical protein